ncbi:MAG: hypothetical protein COB24_09415 [Hyphomicrobiales bacterium]|nr:MAG: hypothetical protein COB24_09415 [Hyphomicrobiales bacterium]
MAFQRPPSLEGIRIVDFTKSLGAEKVFDQTIERVKHVLAENGFGVLTTIDIKVTFRNKLDVDFRPYTILGACKPDYAYKALCAEPHIGTILPCNVIIQDYGDDKVEISAVDPLASLQAIENPALGDFAFLFVLGSVASMTVKKYTKLMGLSKQVLLASDMWWLRFVFIGQLSL